MSPILSLSLLSFSLVASSFATPLSTSHDHDARHGFPFGIAPLHVAEHEAPHGLINDSYIVMLKKDLPLAVLDNHYNFLRSAHAEDPHLDDDSGIRHVFNSYIKGYTGKFTDRVIQRIREMPEVDYVERDQIVKAQEVQSSAPWGLARISHRPKLGFGTFNKYEYEDNGGEGVDVYVIDTGININHVEFEGRASWGKTIPTGDVDDDKNGHGTHCAGTIASRKYGVAKSAHVVAVKVLASDGSGSMSNVIGGVDYAVGAAAEKASAAAAELRATGKTKHKGSVANMSLGGGKSRAVDDAVNGAVASGLHFAVAAGGDGRDACSSSPAGAENPITAGASTLSDERAASSNIGSNNAVNTISGTSAASSHTAGLMAYLLSIYPSATFDPSPSSLVRPEFNAQRPFTGSFASLYGFVYTVMPRWVSGFLPPPRLVEAVTALKAAVIKLASRDVLTSLPADTKNLLIFNNYTTSKELWMNVGF
ncbi:peptidase S8/S53 domain-containing protein [Russula brevipes]|nr:peptidase S8/S53 domain-containing protein [Russula brevipes]